MKRLIVCLSGLLLMYGSVQNAGAIPFSGIVAFGDSLTDAGNVHFLTSSSPYHPDPPAELGYVGGRTTNGNNWVDNLAGLSGLPDPQASLNGGTNYAYAGAKTGSGTNPRFPSPTYPLNPSLNVDRVGTQINSYLSAHTSFQSSQLVLLWSGANDLRDATGLGDILTIVSNLEGHIRTLDAAGAKTVVVPNQLNFSLSPFFLSDPARQGQALFALTTFNNALAARLHTLENDPSLGIRIISVDMFGLSQEVAADPAAFGFTNVTDPVVAFNPVTHTFTQASNPDGYLFYDLIHPTAKFHQLIAEAAFAAIVPEPSTLTLMGFGIVVLGLLRARRKKHFSIL